MENQQPFALIFDFDGLILDTEYSAYESWRQVFEEHGFPFPLEKWIQFVGGGWYNPNEDLEKLLGRPIDHQAIRDDRRARHLAMIDEQDLMPGVRDILAEARNLGLLLGLASSSSYDWVSGYLAKFDLLGVFDCIKTKHDVPETKPNPALFLETLNGLGLRAHQAVVFEDSPKGVAAAKAAGIYTVAVCNRITRVAPMEEADRRVHSLEEISLQELLQTLRPQTPGP